MIDEDIRMDKTTPIRIELPTVFGMKTVNAYLFLTPEPVLVDCGEQTDKSWQALQKALAAHQLTVQDLTKVVITHAHVDHIGMAGKIAKESAQTEIWVSEYAYHWAVNPQEMNNIRMEVMQEYLKLFPEFQSSPFQQMFAGVYKQVKSAWGDIPSEKVRKFTCDDILQMGHMDWQVIYAPGHCNHQTCFYQPNTRQIISADMLLEITPTPVIDVTLNPPYTRERSLHQMIESYHTFAQMAIDKVYPGHYTPFENHREVIDRQLKRIEQRKGECLKHIQAGTHDFLGLFQKLYGAKMTIPALPMLVGYLDLLAADNLIEARKTMEGLRYFAR